MPGLLMKAVDERDKRIDYLTARLTRESEWYRNEIAELNEQINQLRTDYKIANDGLVEAHRKLTALTTNGGNQ